MDKKGRSIMQGRNSRLDGIQAELVIHKLKYLKKDIHKIKKISKLYSEELNNYVITPTAKTSKVVHTYHRYVIRLKSKKERNDLKNYLNLNNIETKIHYSVPLHKFKCFSKYSFKKKLIKSENQSDTILSLPCNQFMNDSEVKYIIKKIKDYFKK